MKIKISVRGKSSEYERLNDIFEEIHIEESDILKLAFEKMEEKYNTIYIDKLNSYILGVEI